MDRNSAFRKEICHKGQHIPVDPPIVHMSAYTKGGLHRLFRQIAHPDKVSFPMYEYGQFTNEAGQFSPVLGVVMASRYRVRQVISRQGQSAVLLLAEDLFCHKKHVVIKVLHASRYQLGAQETHCLWRLALADPWGNSNTVHYLNTFTFDDHYCIVFKPLVPLSLTDIFQDIPAQKLIHSIRKIAVRLLSTLGFLRQQNVIHADLKPENILLRDRNDLSSVTVIDFGNAIQHVHKEIALYYDDFELQTPLYRAPEVMFGMPFGKEIDMWSLGCILAELFLSKPLFMGNSKMDIMKQITSLLGPFPGRTFQRGKFYSNFQHFTDNVEQPDATELLQSHLGCRDYLLADFLSGLLRYNPDERMTPFEAAKHSFLAPEFPFGYLLPPSSDNGSASYLAVHLNRTKYKHRPSVAADIRRSQPCTYDILSLGTALKEEEQQESPLEAGDTPNKHGKVAKVVPVQRERSLGRDPRGSGEVNQRQNIERNQVTIETTRKGFSHVQKVKKEKMQQNCSPHLIQEATLRDKRREQRDQQDYKHKQWETNWSAGIQRQREAHQNHSLAKKRWEIEKELLASHRPKDDHYNQSLFIEHPSTGRCGPAGRSETINPGSPTNLRTEKAEVSSNVNSNRINSRSSDRNREERSRFDMVTVTEQQSLMGGNDVWKNRVVRHVTQPAERSRDNGSDQFQSTSEDEKLTKEDELPPFRKNYRRREITPNSHIDQTISRNADTNERCNKYDLQDQELQSKYEDEKLSRSQSEFKGMNETFIIDSDYSTASAHGKSYNQNKRQSPGDQKNEIIRPCPGWFSRKRNGDGSCKYNDNMTKEHTTARRSGHQKPNAESQADLNREVKSNSDSVTSEYMDCHPGTNTNSLDQQGNTQILDIHGKMKHKSNFCPKSPGYSRKKLMLIPRSPTSLSQEPFVDFQSDSNRPGPYKQCHQESPKQQMQNARQLASLMKAIREEQDLAEYDMSEKEADQHFEVDSWTAGDQRDNSKRKVRVPEKCMSSSKMYDSVSENELKSFEEESHNDNGYERKSGYNTATFETIVRPTTQFPTYNNLEKGQDYLEQRRNPAFISNLSKTNVKEEKYLKTDEASENRAAHWKKKHLHQSSPDVVSTSRQNFVCEDSTDDSNCPVDQKSANTLRLSSEIPAVSTEEPTHLKTKAKCKSGSRAQSQVYNADMCYRTSNDAGNNNFTLDQKSNNDEETVSSKTRNRKTLNIYDHNTDKLSDQDIAGVECKIPASQKDMSNKDTLMESEDGYSSTASTESTVVTRSNNNREGSENNREGALPTEDSTATDSHLLSRPQESDLGKQILQSKVKVKKVARKRLNFTQALKPRKTNKTKVKTLSKPRVTPIIKQHSNRKEEDPYVFLNTPEKDVSCHAKENSKEIFSGCRKSKQMYSNKISDTRKKGRKKCSQTNLVENPNQDLKKQRRKYRRKNCSQIDSEESCIEMQQKKFQRRKTCSPMSSEGNLNQNLGKQPKKFHTKFKGNFGEEFIKSRQEQTQITRSKELQEGLTVFSEEKSSHQSCKKSNDVQFYRKDCRPTRTSAMTGQTQQPTQAENNIGQKHKRKAVSFPRTSIKRQKSSNNWDSDCNSKISCGQHNKNGMEMQHSSDRFSVESRDKSDKEYGECFEDSEGEVRSDLGAVEENCLYTEVTKSKKYRTEETWKEEYNFHHKKIKESNATNRWQCGAKQYRTHHPEFDVSEDDYQAAQTGCVAKSRNHYNKSPKKSHPTGHQHKSSLGLDSMQGKSVAKRCNMVAIGKSRRMTIIDGNTSMNKIEQRKSCLQNKFSSAISEDINQQHHHLGRLDRDQRHVMLQREEVQQQNEMYIDSSVEESVGEYEMHSSGSEEVLLM